MKLLGYWLRFAAVICVLMLVNKLFSPPNPPELKAPTMYSELERLNNNQNLPNYSFLKPADYSRFHIPPPPPTLSEQLEQQAKMHAR